MVRKVLVVDDNEKNRKLLKVILGKAGYQVLEAENGEQAVVMARENRPDIVLMDYRMPVMDGIAATRAIKSDPATTGTPVFIVTASAMSGDRDRIIRESGCDMLFTKPVMYQQISAAVKETIGG